MIIIASAVSLDVDDVEAASQFFTDVFGFREELVLDGLVQLRRDDGAIDIELRAGGTTATTTAICFTVTDLLAEYARLRVSAAHFEPVLRYEPWGERCVSLTGPNGIAVRLLEWIRPAGSGSDRGRS